MKWAPTNLGSTESPRSGWSLMPLISGPVGKKKIAEPQEVVLKEQEGRAGGIKAIAMRLDGNHLGDPWNALSLHF